MKNELVARKNVNGNTNKYTILRGPIKKKFEFWSFSANYWL